MFSINDWLHLNDDQLKKLDKWEKKKRKKKYDKFSLMFSPTSIGIKVVAICHSDNTELDLTDYDTW